MDEGQRYRANPDVVCCPEAEGAILFHPDSEDSVAINAVGYRIWQALARPHTLSEIVASLAAVWQEVPADQVAADVRAFLEVLQRRGFIGKVLSQEGALVQVQFLPSGKAQPGHPPLSPALSSQGKGQPAPPPATVSPPECFHFYRGRSMAGTFRRGDLLTVEPLPIAALRPGDVVLFRRWDPSGHATDIVHRVVAIWPQGLMTKGDNNRRADAELVTDQQLLGRVTHRIRAGRVRRVPGGRWGQLGYGWSRGWRQVRDWGWRGLRAVGRRPYRWLRQSGLVRRLWQPRITVLCLETGDSVEVQYLHHGRTVARWQPAAGRFSCIKPYDLVILRPDGGRSVQ